MAYITVGIKTYIYAGRREVTINVARIATNCDHIKKGCGSYLIGKAAAMAYYINKVAPPISFVSTDAYLKKSTFRGHELDAKEFFHKVGFDPIEKYDRNKDYPDEDTQVMLLNIGNKDSRAHKFMSEIFEQERASK